MHLIKSDRLKSEVDERPPAYIYKYMLL